MKRIKTYKMHFVFELALLIQLLLFSTVLFSQTSKDVYGIEVNDQKKLFFKVRIIMNDNKACKGFLKELKDSSIVVSTFKHVSLNSQERHIVEIPIREINRIRFAKINQPIKDYLITQWAYYLAAIIIDATQTTLLDYYFGIELFTVAVTIISLPFAIQTSTVINRVQQLKVKLRGSQEIYASEFDEMRNYLSKKTNKKRHFKR